MGGGWICKRVNFCLFMKICVLAIQLGGCVEHTPVKEGPPAYDDLWQVSLGDQQLEVVMLCLVHDDGDSGGANYGQWMPCCTCYVKMVGISLFDRDF